ncbi:MAG: hypothetical protein OEW18_01575 [Candidatus Aminicenantes bacterium]|nr:hypothetical protein [Candidatus Aminicenantes bacterium]
MKIFRAMALTAAILSVFAASSFGQQPRVDLKMAAKIREEGLQRSQVMDIVGYISDVLGAWLTLSAEDLMKNAVIMAVFAYEAAMAEERIPRKTVVVEAEAPEKKDVPPE